MGRTENSLVIIVIGLFQLTPKRIPEHPVSLFGASLGGRLGRSLTNEMTGETRDTGFTGLHFGESGSFWMPHIYVLS